MGKPHHMLDHRFSYSSVWQDDAGCIRCVAADETGHSSSPECRCEAHLCKYLAEHGDRHAKRKQQDDHRHHNQNAPCREEPQVKTTNEDHHDHQRQSLRCPAAPCQPMAPGTSCALGFLYMVEIYMVAVAQ